MASIRAPTYLAPRVPIDKLPPSEHDHARFIDMLLRDLGRRCGDFDAALKLFDRCTEFLENPTNQQSDEYSLRWHWRTFAAREAVTTVYRIFECLEYSNKNLGKCPELRKMVDAKLRRSATKAFKENFPGVSGVRHGLQHYAALYGTPEDFAAHASSGEPNFVNHLDGRTVRTTYQKKHIALEISQATLLKLREIRDLYWHAYMAATGQAS